MFINELSIALKQPLPGVPSHQKMANANRIMQPPDTLKVRNASVMILFYRANNEWYIPLIQRQDNNPNDKHGGQISLPGGKYENSDTSFAHTAVREAEEEIGIIGTEVELLGQLTNLYVPVSNFLVRPFVGHLSEMPTFQKQLTEVKAILEVPFSTLQDETIIKKTNLTLPQGIRLKNVPHFEINGHIVWGATAMILSELLDVLRTHQVSI